MVGDVGSGGSSKSQCRPERESRRDSKEDRDSRLREKKEVDQLIMTP